MKRKASRPTYNKEAVQSKDASCMSQQARLYLCPYNPWTISRFFQFNRISQQTIRITYYIKPRLTSRTSIPSIISSQLTHHTWNLIPTGKHDSFYVSFLGDKGALHPIGFSYCSHHPTEGAALVVDQSFQHCCLSFHAPLPYHMSFVAHSCFSTTTHP